MRYCTNCGKEYGGENEICDECAGIQPSIVESNQDISAVIDEEPVDPMRFVKENNFQEAPLVYDKQSGGINFISFLYPIVGFVLYFDVRKNKPKEAHGAAVWAWFGVIIRLVVFILLVVAMFGLFMNNGPIIDELPSNFPIDISDLPGIYV